MEAFGKHHKNVLWDPVPERPIRHSQGRNNGILHRIFFAFADQCFLNLLDNQGPKQVQDAQHLDNEPTGSSDFRVENETIYRLRSILIRYRHGLDIQCLLQDANEEDLLSYFVRRGL